MITNLVVIATLSAGGLQGEIQHILHAFSSSTGGFGFTSSVCNAGGCVSAEAGMRTPPGFPALAPGNMTVNSTFILGSGSKVFTATGILRAVDAGRLGLKDTVVSIVDEMMDAIWNTTLSQLFGPLTSNLTVGHLIRMESGLADVEGVPGWESAALCNDSSVHNPIWDLVAVANLTSPWHFAPGTNSEYSSTNFLVAVLVLMALEPRAEWSWKTFDQRASLGSDFKDRFPNIFFPTTGIMHRVGLNCVGQCRSFTTNTTPIWQQDAGIMGMGWGAATASMADVARFFYSLIGQGSIVSPESLARMQNFHNASHATYWYGAGLEAVSPSPQFRYYHHPPLDDISTGFGHHGGTYGFEFLGGYFHKLNASIAVAINADHLHREFLYGAACGVVQAVVREVGLTRDLNCSDIPLLM